MLIDDILARNHLTNAYDRDLKAIINPRLTLAGASNTDWPACIPGGMAVMELPNYKALRQAYWPEVVTLVIVAESPPVPKNGKPACTSMGQRARYQNHCSGRS